LKSHIYNEDDVAEICFNSVLNVAVSPNTVLAYTSSFKHNVYFICFLCFKTSSWRL